MLPPVSENNTHAHGEDLPAGLPTLSMVRFPVIESENRCPCPGDVK